MATIVLGAVGTLLGGPIGGAIGTLLGSAADKAILGSGSREGPRLSELKITTSSYGVAIPRHFGRMRVPGQIIWSTDLIEHKEKQGGGKGTTSVTAYSYSASFAVALASRPLLSIGRIWADGQLLRGAAGDLKVGGAFRFYSGFGDQEPDPLIAAAEGSSQCPAYRGLAYVVFEDLALSDFGNRIPSLSFEVFADTAPLSLAGLLEDKVPNGSGSDVLPGIAGLSVEGPMAETVATFDPILPIDIDANGDALAFSLAAERPQQAILLPEATTANDAGSFGRASGFAQHRQGARNAPLRVLRYYDIDRDFQPGTQRASGPTGAGQPRSVDLPASLFSDDARKLVEQAAKRSDWGEQTISWRIAQLDPGVRPGAKVMLPGRPGNWRVLAWEWREHGVELSLVRMPPTRAAPRTASDPGRANCAADEAVGGTSLAVCELPWDGSSTTVPQVLAVASSSSPGWRGASLYLEHGDGALDPLGTTGRTRGVMGKTTGPLPPASPLLFDRSARLDIQLAAADLALSGATMQQLAMGANRAVVGEEIVQFAKAQMLGNGQWRLSGFWRGRGGTEGAVGGHLAGEDFILLDGSGTALNPAVLGILPDVKVAALGVADTEPVSAFVRMRGIGTRPPSPVHGRWSTQGDGLILLTWTRRTRGSWIWLDEVETPLGETTEAYEVSFGESGQPIRRWETSAPQLPLSATEFAEICALSRSGLFLIRQRGDRGISNPLAVHLPLHN